MPTKFSRHCMRCGTRMVRRDDHGTPRATCPACGFVHYRNPAPAAGVVLAGREGVLMVRRRFDPAAGAWCLPAGFMEYGETPERCALRELREETGIRARLTGLFGVYAGLDDPRVRSVLILYAAERVSGRLTPGDDAIDARWFLPRRLPRRIAFAAHRAALAEFALLSGEERRTDGPSRPAPRARPPSLAQPRSRATRREGPSVRRSSLA